MLQSLLGVGAWTAAEITQREFGDVDSVSLDDCYILKMIGLTLLGHPIDNDVMLKFFGVDTTGLPLDSLAI
ncbi:hypothetical protein [Mycobacterium uberis]|uniref:hypothetical protein n=1 Tax=Mycobacterium uberis TaxID=2162698 RepID=UPI0014020BAD|nr:hypothetical protein [Mycobacterium uberis]